MIYLPVNSKIQKHDINARFNPDIVDLNFKAEILCISSAVSYNNVHFMINLPASTFINGENTNSFIETTGNKFLPSWRIVNV